MDSGIARKPLKKLIKKKKGNMSPVKIRDIGVSKEGGS